MAFEKPYVVHGRWDNQYCGSEPEFQEWFNTLQEATKFFNTQIEQGAGTIFLEKYDAWGNQIKCYNKGHALEDEE